MAPARSGMTEPPLVHRMPHFGLAGRLCDMTALHCDMTSGRCDMTKAHCDIATGHCDMTKAYCAIAMGHCAIAMGHCDMAKAHCDMTSGRCDMAKAHCDMTMGRCDIAKPHCDMTMGHCDKAKRRCDKKKWPGQAARTHRTRKLRFDQAKQGRMRPEIVLFPDHLTRMTWVLSAWALAQGKEPESSVAAGPYQGWPVPSEIAVGVIMVTVWPSSLL